MRFEINDILKSKKTTLLNIYAQWSVECDRAFEIIKSHQMIIDGDISLLRLNINQHRKLAQTLSIKTVPCIILFRNETELFRHEGPISSEQLENMLTDQVTILNPTLIQHKP